jgi:hypothetical protein
MTEITNTNITTPSGLYYENYGKLNTIQREWTFTTFVDFSKYNNQQTTMTTFGEIVTSFCKTTNVSFDCEKFNNIMKNLNIEITHRRERLNKKLADRFKRVLCTYLSLAQLIIFKI